MNPTTQAWMVKIGSTIRERRDRKSWSQDGLAVASEVSRRTISDMENGERSYRIDRLLAVMYPLDIDPWSFFGGTEKIRPRRNIEHEVLHDALDEI